VNLWKDKKLATHFLDTVSVGVVLFDRDDAVGRRLIVFGVLARLFLGLGLVALVASFFLLRVNTLTLRVFPSSWKLFRLHWLYDFVRFGYLDFGHRIINLLSLAYKGEAITHGKCSFLLLDHFHLVIIPQL
jgi:hypothetical protein